MATFAIGDIHGNLAALDELLGQLTAEIDEGDTVVFLGDFIDRGTASKECVDRLVDFRSMSRAAVIFLMGNHEQAMLMTRQDYGSHDWVFTYSGFSTIGSYSPEAERRIRAALKKDGARVFMERLELPYSLFFDVMPDSHHAFFDDLKLFHRTEDGIFTHGGLDPRGGPVQGQPADSLIFGKKDFAEGYRGSETLVYGHWGNAVFRGKERPEPRILNRTIGLDMSIHGFVCAIRLPDRKTFWGGAWAAGNGLPG